MAERKVAPLGQRKVGQLVGEKAALRAAWTAELMVDRWVVKRVGNLVAKKAALKVVRLVERMVHWRVGMTAAWWVEKLAGSTVDSWAAQWAEMTVATKAVALVVLMAAQLADNSA